jgi:hypothetical protein
MYSIAWRCVTYEVGKTEKKRKNERREEQKKNERTDLEPHLEIFDTGKYKG